jgi:hypothetical protein
MPKLFYFTLIFMIVSGAFAAQAQTNGSDPADATSRQRGSRLLNQDNLTSTGETVPRPGTSQGAPTSTLDRRIEQENNRVDQSICSNCN